MPACLKATFGEVARTEVAHPPGIFLRDGAVADLVVTFSLAIETAVMSPEKLFNARG
jgi:hypothetical protein